MTLIIKESTNVSIIHKLMIQAFSEYQNDISPSSALEETIESIKNDFASGEQALIAYLKEEPVAMVRFQLKDDYIYFSRLSVVPQQQGNGIAKLLLKELEEYTKQNGLHEIRCKVRANIPRNIHLYSSVGYEIFDKEIAYKPNNIELPVVLMKKHLD